MGPKGKSKAQLQKQKSAAQIAQLALSTKTMQRKLDSSKQELEELQFLCDNKRVKIQDKKAVYKLLLDESNNLDLEIADLMCSKDEKVAIISELGKEVANQQSRISYKKQRYSIDCSMLQKCDILKPPAFSISSVKAQKRKRKPYSRDMYRKAKRIRMAEVFTAATLAFGGSTRNKGPILNGLLDTIGENFKSIEVVNSLIMSKEKHMQKLNNNCIISWHNKFYTSHENILRSANVYYCDHVMGKGKYQALSAKLTKILNISNCGLPITSLIKNCLLL